MREPYSNNFDDSSSDEEHYNEIDINSDWERFKREALPDLYKKIQKSIMKEKENKNKNKNKLYPLLVSIQANKKSLLKELENIHEKINNLLTQLKNDEAEPVIEIKKKKTIINIFQN